MQEYIIKQCVISLCVYVGQIVVGAALGWSAPIIPKLQDINQTPLPEVITDGQASWVGSTIYIGTIIGPYVSGYLSNRYGRKPALYVAGAITAAAFIILATSVHIAMIYCGRILAGFGSGMIFVVNLVYLGEMASTNIRGVILTASGIFQTLGTLVVYSTAPYVSYAMSSYVLLIITAAYITGLFLLPESPVFLVMKGKETEAIQSLLALGRINTKDINSVLSAKHATGPTSGWKDLIDKRSNRKALFITLTLGILQQLSGVIAVTMFSTSIFTLAGSTIAPNIATIIIGVTQTVASCVTPLFVEKTGRKLLLMFSCAACFVSLTTLGIYFFLDNAGNDMTVVGWLPLLTLIVFFLSYDFGFGIIPNTFIGEMFGSSARSIGSAITTTIAWLFGFGVSTAFGYMLPVIGGHYTFWIFAMGCALAFIFTVIFVPETKGKTLPEIEDMLSK